jgi:hypothetical protein
LVFLVRRRGKFPLSEVKEKPVENMVGLRRVFALRAYPDSGIKFSAPKGVATDEG